MLLSDPLAGLRTQDSLIVGLYHGGCVVAHAISQKLKIPWDVLIVKKISNPNNPELAIGARVQKGQKLFIGGRTVIIVDDGAATGKTMESAISWVKSKKAKKIIIALPVASPESVRRLRTLTNNIVVLETPSDFHAVGQYYQNFEQTSDEEVVQLLDT